MSEGPSDAVRAVAPGRALRLAVAFGLAVVLARSFVFVFYEGANFDSDQAVFGLMAKHLAELRAFPLFSYAQSYMLAVTTWLAAPVVAVLGPTVTALKLPVLAINLACVWLLVKLLASETALGPWPALAATLPFAVPPVVTAALLTQHSGGNVEPFLYVLLLWVLRARALPFGLLAAVGTLQREFTAYGILALLVLDLAQGRLRDPRRRGFWLKAAVAFAAVFVLVEALRPFSTYPGERGTGAGWSGLGPALARLAALSRLLPLLYGLVPGRQLHLAGGVVHAAARPAFALAALGGGCVLGWRLVRHFVGERRIDARHELPLYLGLIGVLTLAAYVLLGRGSGADSYVRYVLLALFLPVAGLAFCLGVETARWARRLALALVLTWAGMNAVDHARLAAEYAVRRPADPFRTLADDLVAHGIRYGAADYWTAYHVSYLSGERVKLHARGFKRIDEYRTLFLENLDEAVDVRSGGPCPDGRAVAGFCVVGPPAPRRR